MIEVQVCIGDCEFNETFTLKFDDKTNKEELEKSLQVIDKAENVIYAEII